MKKTILSALGLAVALAFSAPVMADAATTTPPKTAMSVKPADSKMTPKASTHKKVSMKVCKPTKKHKCPMKKVPMKAAMKAPMKADAKKAAPKA